MMKNDEKNVGSREIVGAFVDPCTLIVDLPKQMSGRAAPCTDYPDPVNESMPRGAIVAPGPALQHANFAIFRYFSSISIKYQGSSDQVSSVFPILALTERAVCCHRSVAFRDFQVSNSGTLNGSQLQM